MRLLLDECVPKRLGREFDAFITVDQGIPFQQNLSASPIPVIVLVAPSNAIDSLRPLVVKALEALRDVRRGQVVRVAG